MITIPTVLVRFVCLGLRCGLKLASGRFSFKSSRKLTILSTSKWPSSTSSSQMVAGL